MAEGKGDVPSRAQARDAFGTAFAVTLAVMAEKHGAQYNIKKKMLFLCTSIIDRTFESIKLITTSYYYVVVYISLSLPNFWAGNPGLQPAVNTIIITPCYSSAKFSIKCCEL
jgi:hypothetical protein